MIINIDKLKQMLVQEECRDSKPALKPYYDSVHKLTIGVGRNLDDVGISDREAMFMLDNDVAKAIGLLIMNLPWVELLDEVRQRVLADTCFNMGIGDDKHGLLSFKNALYNFQLHNYERAAQHFEKSKWYRQVGTRGVKLVKMIRTGRDN